MIKKILVKTIDKSVSLLSRVRSKLQVTEPPVVNSHRDIQIERNNKWYEGDPENTRRFDYPLTPSSIVMDLGGYDGQWASDIFGRYGCRIYIFEPYLPFANKIRKRFEHNEKIKIFDFGLGRRDAIAPFCVQDNASSMYIGGTKNETISIKSANAFLREQRLGLIDLLKINIEGGEYELLECLLDEGFIQHFRNIQVQFHDFIISDAAARMRSIHQRLSITHEPTYQYDFVWDNWKLKE